MKKAIIATSAIVILLAFNFASANSTAKGNPFQELWGAIDWLQEQIDNIELIPGPQGEQGAQGESGIDGQDGLSGEQGEQGEQGAQGPQGEQGVVGPQGLMGPSLKVVDVNNNYIGPVTSLNINNLVTFYSNLNIPLRYDGSLAVDVNGFSNSTGRIQDLFYSENDCLGDAYTTEDYNNPHLLILRPISYGPMQYWRADSYNDVESNVYLGSIKRANGLCSGNYDTVVPIAMKIHQISGPVFNGPLEVIVE